MRHFETFDDVRYSFEFLMLSDFEYSQSLDNHADSVEIDMKSEEYLEAFYNNFFLFKRVLADTTVTSITSSTEAIANMSKANQKTREDLDGYTRSLFKWVDQVLVPTIKNTQRLATAMSRTMRNQETRQKLEKAYKTTDLRTDEYQQYFNDLCEMLTVYAQTIEKIQNVNDSKDVVEVQSAVNSVGEKGTETVTRINEFNTKRAGEESKVSPSDGHWFADSYLNQLAGTMNRVMNTCLQIKRSRSSIHQILNAMVTTSDNQTRKMNKVKLDAIKGIVHEQFKPNMGAISRTALSIGQKLQQLYKMTMSTSVNTQVQVPTKAETTEA